MPRPKIHYAWIVAIVTFVVILVTAGHSCDAGRPDGPARERVRLEPDRDLAAVAINIALFGLIGPFAASVMDRWGLRRVILAAVALLAVSVALTTQNAHAVGADAPVGRAGRDRYRRHLDGAGRHRRQTLVRRAARCSCSGRCRRPTRPVNWCSCRCSPGWSSSGGWRAAALLVAGASVVVFAIVFLFMRDRPEDLGLRPYGQAADHAAPTARRWRRSKRSARSSRDRHSGSWAALSSSAGRAPTASSARISSRPATTTASPRCARRSCLR